MNPVQAWRPLAPVPAIAGEDLARPPVRIRAHRPLVRTAAKGEYEGDGTELQAGDDTSRAAVIIRETRAWDRQGFEQETSIEPKAGSHR